MKGVRAALALLGGLALWVIAVGPVRAADLAAVLKRQELAGATWFTLRDGHTAVGAAGMRNVATRAPMTADTRVHVGSVAKVVLATGVLRLVSTGRLALDAPVAPLLPGLAIENPWQATAPVRVRHLLEHTSGLDARRLWQIFSLDAHPDTPLAAAFARDGELLRVRSRPGSQFGYSDMGYALLGIVIESVTGERYERWLDREVLAPLAMAGSTFAYVTQARDARLAMGHFDGYAPQAAVPTWLRPATQFTTTAADMARLAGFLMGDGTLGGRTFIDRELLARLAVPADTDAARAGLAAGHGLALATRDRHGAIGACHPGTTVGFQAMLCLYPQQRRAFFWAVNMDSETAGYEALTAALLAELALPSVPAHPVVAAPPPHAWQGFYVPAPGPMATFALADRIFGGMRLSVDGDALLLQPLQGQPQRLLPAGGMLYRATDRVAPSHVLLRTADGGYLVSNGLRPWRRQGWPATIALWGSMTAGLAGLAWIVLRGGWRLVRRRGDSNVLAWPLAATAALLLPLPLFLGQSFLRLGERTAAGMTLAAVTALLPVVLAVALAVGLMHGWRRRAAPADLAALAAALQWLLVMAWWGMIPLRLWA